MIAMLLCIGLRPIKILTLKVYFISTSGIIFCLSFISNNIKYKILKLANFWPFILYLCKKLMKIIFFKNNLKNKSYSNKENKPN